MRDIKFRAWNKKESFMDSAWLIDWEHGLVAHSSHNQSDLEDCVLMQYTGLKDKNGKKVFENDLCKYDDILYQVVWDKDYARYGLKVIKTDYVYAEI
jgi:uncharacterized phage protein (TIGR01671 family)